MKKITKTTKIVLAVGILLIGGILLLEISNTYQSYLINSSKRGTRVDSCCAKSSSFPKIIDGYINRLLVSDSNSFPPNTIFLGTKTEGEPHKEKVTITLDFNKAFISQGEDFVYKRSIPLIINTIEEGFNVGKSDFDAEYVFLIEGEPLEQALQREYKD